MTYQKKLNQLSFSRCEILNACATCASLVASMTRHLPRCGAVERLDFGFETNVTYQKSDAPPAPVWSHNRVNHVVENESRPRWQRGLPLVKNVSWLVV